jgi:hypothetical protein
MPSLRMSALKPLVTLYAFMAWTREVTLIIFIASGCSENFWPSMLQQVISIKFQKPSTVLEVLQL